MGPFGAVAPITTCPHCSVLVDGSCIQCQDGETHPSCKFCKGGEHKPPWHKSELMVAFASAVLVSVGSAIIASEIRKKLRMG